MYRPQCTNDHTFPRPRCWPALLDTQLNTWTTHKQPRTTFWCTLDTFETIWNFFGHFEKNRKISKNWPLMTIHHPDLCCWPALRDTQLSTWTTQNHFLVHLRHFWDHLGPFWTLFKKSKKIEKWKKIEIFWNFFRYLPCTPKISHWISMGKIKFLKKIKKQNFQLVKKKNGTLGVGRITLKSHAESSFNFRFAREFWFWG